MGWQQEGGGGAGLRQALGCGRASGGCQGKGTFPCPTPPPAAPALEPPGVLWGPARGDTGRPQGWSGQPPNDVTPPVLSPPHGVPYTQALASKPPHLRVGSGCTHHTPAGAWEQCVWGGGGGRGWGAPSAIPSRPVISGLLGITRLDPESPRRGTGWGLPLPPALPAPYLGSRVLGSNAIFPGGCHGSLREVTK